MPQHKSAVKRVRQNAKRRERNRIHRSRMRTLIKKLQATEDKTEATLLLKEVKACLDRMATKRLIHKSKAANYKSSLEKRVNALG
jgi:small subunit ribosomal protein S20